MLLSLTIGDIEWVNCDVSLCAPYLCVGCVFVSMRNMSEGRSERLLGVSCARDASVLGHVQHVAFRLIKITSPRHSFCSVTLCGPLFVFCFAREPRPQTPSALRIVARVPDCFGDTELSGVENFSLFVREVLSHCRFSSRPKTTSKY